MPAQVNLNDSSKLNAKLNTWKKKLLDTSKRNQLLNFKDYKSSTLAIQEPTIEELWERLVVQERPLKFPLPKGNPLLDEIYSPAISDVTSYENPDGVVTNKSIEDLLRTLRNLRAKAKLGMEEQGINFLYLSFGFLNWKEQENSEQSFPSPLILVPVKLTVESLLAPFVLSLSEDEIVTNPTLFYKLEHDFGITLPEFDQDQSPLEYFDQVQQKLGNYRFSCSIKREVKLGLLSFHKINMYRDLEKRSDSILQHPVICAIGGDVRAIQDNLSLLASINNFDHDAQEPPDTIFQVLDADSSQQDAILAAKKGISFILQGPPGTGKSQTITNIIAESMAMSKSVLFVSEKMAALDVVLKRLTESNLSDFCLVLHDRKANKKDVLDQLGAVLSLSGQKCNLVNEARESLDKLKKYREQLNQYDKEIHHVILPLNTTIFQVNGILASLASCKDISFSLNNIEKVSQEELSELLADLATLSSKLGDMSDDYLKNPWKGAKVEQVTNTLRQDIEAILPPLIAQISEFSQILEFAGKLLSISFDSRLSVLDQIATFFQLASKSPKAPSQWVQSDDLAELFNLVDKWSELQAQYQNSKKELEEKYHNVAAIDATGIFPVNSSSAVFSLEQIKSFCIEALSARDYYRIWQSLGTPRATIIDEAESKIIRARELVETLRSEFDNDLFDLNAKELYQKFKTDYASSFRFLKRCYRTDLRKLRTCLKNPLEKMTYEKTICVLKKLRDLDELRQWRQERDIALSNFLGTLYQQESTDFALVRKAQDAYDAIIRCQSVLQDLEELLQAESKNNQYLKGHFAHYYDGFSTDWNLVRSVLEWASELKKSLAVVTYTPSFIDGICTDDTTIAICASYAEQVRRHANEIINYIQRFSDLFYLDEKDLIQHTPLPELTERLAACKDNLAELEKWVDLHASINKCTEDGLQDYILKIQRIHVPSKDIVNIFKKRFYYIWLDSMLPHYPAVAQFRRQAQEGYIKQFQTLDKLQLAIAKARVRANLINSLPPTDRFTSGVDEVSILKREMMKQRKIMPIRKLFNTIPDLIMTLKPCLMMSPLSVSQFLESDHFMFDTVIFDEASQVRTEDAIGAISRGTQVIIAGDSKQLPPTNFFTAFLNEPEYDTSDDDEDYEDAYESVLEEAALLPERTLLWHYRSLHEDLIAYSNAKIYKNSLITFPSSLERVPGYAVEFIFVPGGIYDQGGRRGNPREAERVADLVFEHIHAYSKNSKERSLGVIAFGDHQQQAIEMAIRKRRLADQRYEDFFNEDKFEAFFVKNLENVQGDERDTIIISVGYAKSPAGRPPTNFGPIMHSGGERRLNVAITRARYNTKLVSSIEPTDITAENFSHAGPKLLRGYMEFAQRGRTVLENEIKDSGSTQTESPFEEAVYNFLAQHGYQLATQIGCSGYRIDIGVKHPTLPGRYVLGIECDGATYHSARTARERDRLRQDVLERMGWKIYRVWSTDWIKDPLKEGNDLIRAIEKAIQSYEDDPSLQAPLSMQDAEKGDYLTISQNASEASSNTIPYGFISPKKLDQDSMPYDGHYSQNKMCTMIQFLVNNQYPLHIDYLCEQIASYLGCEKTIYVLRQDLIYDVGLLQLQKHIKRKGSFLYPAAYEKIPHYVLSGRPIKYVSKDEIASAMLAIANVCIGLTRESLITETIHAFGFVRTGNTVKAAMNAVYEKLMIEHQLKEQDGKVSVVD